MADVGYCEEEDLLLGRLQGRLPPSLIPADFIINASREIDSKIGMVYVTPFTLSGDGALPAVSFDLPAPVIRWSHCAPHDSPGSLGLLRVEPRAPRAPPLLPRSSA